MFGMSFSIEHTKAINSCMEPSQCKYIAGSHAWCHSVQPGRCEYPRGLYTSAASASFTALIVASSRSATRRRHLVLAFFAQGFHRVYPKLRHSPVTPFGLRHMGLASYPTGHIPSDVPASQGGTGRAGRTPATTSSGFLGLVPRMRTPTWPSP